jgi:16S rRNA (cytosine1402-N4)-methyltransferase
MMVRMTNPYHTPVLLQACIEYLNIEPTGTYVDLTFGGGGHSKAMLEALGKSGRLFAFDQDEAAVKNAPKDPRFTLIPHNFRFIRNYLRLYGVTRVNGILGDLGVSSHQFDEAERGFSLRFEGPLDMRMNQSSELTAAKVLNTYPLKKLAAMFREYGELPHAGKIANAVVERRSTTPLSSTSELKETLRHFAPRHEEHKFFARVFQALRIEVNEEMEALKECLTDCVTLLEKGGRLVFISYHSLEDRMVKNLMRSGNVEGIVKRDAVFGTTEKIFNLLTTRSVTPSEEEIESNSRARSARLRAAEKL